MVKEAVEIPEGEVLDVHVAEILYPGEQVKEEAEVKEEFFPENLPTKWTVGNDCLARWADDCRWYNAIVDTVIVSTPVKYLVTFLGYGNSAVVSDDDLAANKDAISTDQLDMLAEKVHETLPVAQETPTLPDVLPKQIIRKPLVRSNFDCIA